MLGKVENTRVSEYYQEYAFYIMASNFEGMPKTLIEAMMNGCIVIGTPVVGINELIKPNLTGFLSRSTKSKDLVVTVMLFAHFLYHHFLVIRVSTYEM